MAPQVTPEQYALMNSALQSWPNKLHGKSEWNAWPGCVLYNLARHAGIYVDGKQDNLAGESPARQKISKRYGIPERRLTRWQERNDLYVLDGKRSRILKGKFERFMERCEVVSPDLDEIEIEDPQRDLELVVSS